MSQNDGMNGYDPARLYWVTLKSGETFLGAWWSFEDGRPSFFKPAISVVEQGRWHAHSAETGRVTGMPMADADAVASAQVADVSPPPVEPTVYSCRDCYGDTWTLAPQPPEYRRPWRRSRDGARASFSEIMQQLRGGSQMSDGAASPSG